ncbi:glycosyl hydrolase 115 family protein [Neolewinella lacunae]|uniref:Glycosyl hydrolase 115 family protein n=1 Tax=Neolewinella lacunae TaxID=1517758 RepID=A0A923PJC6_9BACT|nr:glycosyl hydrolase 115 family protein [Neolewinella lacunae]MBC6995147.1 glycosyl hydrolase 115 family protein [Neolewinella lacunae]MDN3634097.1 glycosyl hydrolase 115 family protein [Neolewinella lacunae]
MDLLKLLPLLLFFFTACTTNKADIDWGADAGAEIVLGAGLTAPTLLAVEDLRSDLEKITGVRPALAADPKNCQPCIVIERDSALASGWERYRIEIGADRIRISGGDERGLMFGIYHFLEHQLEVDPLYFWSGREPQRREQLTLAAMDYTSESPDFKYRGWFINDEDLLTEWMDSGGKRNIRYPFYGDVVNEKAMDHVVEAAVRLRFNLIIPASFLDIKNPPERALLDAAARRGLFLSMHHIEPLGVSAFTYQNYWKARGEEPLFSFYSAREKVETTWREYAREWAQYDNVIWQVGLRGIGDRPMWMADPGTPQSDAERASLISEAMALQKKIITETTGDENPIMTTTLWAEGAYFNQHGLLRIPRGVITVFADNNPGWHWQPDFYATEREPGRQYGVYYHHQVWGWGPHLAQAIPPRQTAQVLGEAYTSGAHEYAILNVSNVREFLPGLAASSDMLWKMRGFDGDVFLRNWAAENFPSAPDAVHRAYLAYFDGYAGFGDRNMPGFLDGQTKHEGQAALKRIREILANGYTPPQESPQTNKKADPFHAALAGADPKKGLPLAEKTARLATQIAHFQSADSLSSVILTQLATDQERQLLSDNLRTHIQLQLALGHWLHALLRAELALQHADENSGKTLLADAVEALLAVENIKAGASHGKWQHWYRGDKKMNLPGLLEETQKLVGE